jgi:ATP phosphoribosyltransferase
MGEFVIALSKGRLYQKSLNALMKIGLADEEVDFDLLSRKLIFYDQKRGNKYLIAKPKDIPIYIEHGIADIGITGKDVIMEHDKNLYELMDLGFGSCELVVAAPEESKIRSLNDIPEHSVVATTYPNIVEEYFSKQNIQVNIIYLNGSVELAPRVGLSDIIVDISSTGTTLKKNNLIPIASIMDSSARLVVNNVTYKVKYERIKNILTRGNEDENAKLSVG